MNRECEREKERERWKEQISSKDVLFVSKLVSNMKTWFAIQFLKLLVIHKNPFQNIYHYNVNVFYNDNPPSEMESLITQNKLLFMENAIKSIIIDTCN